jgi:antiviral helicase SKI2
MAVADNPSCLEYFPLTSQNIELSKDLQKLAELRDHVAIYQPYTNVPNFVENFSQVFDRKVLEEKKENLLFQLSNKNLSLYPDYCNKLLVLQELKYIDELHQGEFKKREEII